MRAWRVRLHASAQALPTGNVVKYRAKSSRECVHGGCVASSVFDTTGALWRPQRAPCLIASQTHGQPLCNSAGHTRPAVQTLKPAGEPQDVRTSDRSTQGAGNMVRSLQDCPPAAYSLQQLQEEQSTLQG